MSMTDRWGLCPSSLQICLCLDNLWLSPIVKASGGMTTSQLGVSRPVVHEGLLELAARGLVTIRPRHGAIVSDYRTQGSVTMLASLLAYQQGELDEA